MDFETLKTIITLKPTNSNNYLENNPEFDVSDKLVLCGGVLWDSIAGKKIYKFDQLSYFDSGKFHPNGFHVIILCIFSAY